ncbi:hypothetical protein CIB95_07175 [Lottiidibacillus patelloidae]|uniref:ATP-dependent DNA helicase RecQ n=1 Tax=Lottiidibacillus patelloidae TaxID=2670334 RepID=A0A263BUI7_9BACI|nr:ATP-dependent DNA helicase RecQ [Lottiidibacillus patelloidae]OZM57238.1 hypothetical protein CIB95_07175 [Lottiidibacillus patelloidae]
MNLEKLLKEKFGYATFRTGQKEIITDLLEGKDVFAMLPTGAGKSLTYLMPGYVFEGIIVIVSPLLSLMEDQVKELKKNGEKRVVAINSFINKYEKSELLLNLDKFKFIFLSPETLQNKFIIKQLQQQVIALFVVDEAHCISQWGHEFRTDYLKLGEIKKTLGSPPCLALTATAPNHVQNDIIDQLQIPKAVKHIYNIDRPNIALHVKRVYDEKDKINELIRFVENLQGPGIIYFSSRKMTEKIAQIIKEETNLKVAAYHGGLEQEDRILLQQQFVEGQLDVICCTSAFGMGVNKPDTRFVIHYHFPGQIESYVQEIGRAGRDGKESVAILLYLEEDTHIPKRLVEHEFPSPEIVDELFNLVSKYSQESKQLHIEDENEWCEKLQISETMWRFLKFQLERLSILKGTLIGSIPEQEIFTNSIMKVIHTRKHFKYEKLNEMLLFLQTETCLRQYILAIFNQEMEKKPDNCCTNCIFKEETFFRKQGIEQTHFPFNWKKELHTIFNQSEIK